MSQINLHPYSAALLQTLKDVEVEVYCGDIKTTQVLHDYTVQEKNVLRGIIRDAVGDCVMIECHKNNLKTTVFLNVWSIKAVVKMADPLFIKDVFSSEESFKQDKRRVNDI